MMKRFQKIKTGFSNRHINKMHFKNKVSICNVHFYNTIKTARCYAYTQPLCEVYALKIRIFK